MKVLLLLLCVSCVHQRVITREVTLYCPEQYGYKRELNICVPIHPTVKVIEKPVYAPDYDFESIDQEIDTEDRENEEVIEDTESQLELDVTSLNLGTNVCARHYDRRNINVTGGCRL